MTSRFFQIIWLAVAFLGSTALAEENIRWAPDLAQARVAAAQFKVPLLIHFYGDHCLPCKTLEERVLSQKEVIETLNKYFICIRVNASLDRMTAAEFQVHSWPTDVFVSPDGKTLYQGVCPQDLRNYISTLENVAVMNRDRNTMLAAAQPTQPAAGIAQQAASVGQGSAMNSGLPAPGSQTSSGSPTPSFYTAAAVSQAQQALPVSTSPQQGVQSGPLIASSQPAGITGSTPRSEQQLSSPTPPDFNSSQQGQLPARPELQASIPAPVDRRSESAQNPAFAHIPTREAHQDVQAAGPSATGSTQNHIAQAGSQLSRSRTPDNAQTLNNPYYVPPMQPNYAGASPANVATDAQPGNTAQATLGPALPSYSPQTNPLIATAEGSLPPAAAVGNNPYGLGMAASAASKQSSSGPAPAAGNSPRDIPAQSVSFQPRGATLPPSLNQQPEPQAALPGIGGYCPVALKSSGQWVEGKPQFAVKHRGRVYWLSSQQAMQDFLKSPDAASPVLSGYDPMIFLTEGRLVEGELKHGLHEEDGGKILFFANEQSKDQFERDYDKNSRALNVILSDAGVK